MYFYICELSNANGLVEMYSESRKSKTESGETPGAVSALPT